MFPGHHSETEDPCVCAIPVICFAELPGKSLHKKSREEWNIGAPLTQWRQKQWENVQAIVEIGRNLPSCTASQDRGCWPQ